MDEQRLREIFREELAMRDGTSPPDLLERDKIYTDLIDLARRLEDDVLDPEAKPLVHKLISIAESVCTCGYKVEEIAEAYVHVDEEKFLADPKKFLDQVKKDTQLLVHGDLSVLGFTARIGQ